jgi:hypothetical protein
MRSTKHLPVLTPVELCLTYMYLLDGYALFRKLLKIIVGFPGIVLMFYFVFFFSEIYSYYRVMNTVKLHSIRTVPSDHIFKCTIPIPLYSQLPTCFGWQFNHLWGGIQDIYLKTSYDFYMSVNYAVFYEGRSMFYGYFCLLVRIPSQPTLYLIECYRFIVKDYGIALEIFDILCLWNFRTVY